MKIENRVRLSIKMKPDDVFLRSDFAKFGSPAQVGRALADLVNDGALVKLGLGVYAKAKASVLSGKPIPTKPVEVLAPDVFRKLGVAITPSQATDDYNSGQTTQVPVGVVFNTGTKRISRKIGFNGKFVTYEKNKQK